MVGLRSEKADGVYVVVTSRAGSAGIHMNLQSATSFLSKDAVINSDVHLAFDWTLLFSVVVLLLKLSVFIWKTFHVEK